MKEATGFLGYWAIGRIFFLKFKFHFLLFIFSFLILTRFNIDPDLGWHLAIGQKFLEEGQIVRGDSFSWTMPGYAWGNSYFAYQVLVAYLFENFGHVLAGLFWGAVAALGVLILLPARIDLAKAIAVGLGAIVALANLGIRPHTVSFLMFSILIIFLKRGLFKKTHHLFFWFAFFAIWANFHRGFVVGFLVISTFILIDLISNKSNKKKNYLVGTLAIFSAFLGTFVTPFQISAWKSAVFLDLTSRENLLWIAEWQPIGEVFPYNFVFVLTGIVFIYIFLKKFAGSKDQPLFLIAATIFMFSFVAATFLLFWSAIFIFLATRHLEFKLNLKELSPKLSLTFSTAAVFLVFFLNFVVRILESSVFERQLEIDQYPAKAVSYLKSKGLTDGLFNSYEWGGYLDWQAPQIKIFIDGRMPSWRSSQKESVFKDYLAISKGKCEPFDKYEITTALVKKDFDESCFGNWNKVYEDSVAKVLVKP